jgi:hypothetical protein
MYAEVVGDNADGCEDYSIRLVRFFGRLVGFPGTCF